MGKQMDFDYDIAIVGGGPGGATLARLLAPSFRILLLDKKDFEGNPGFKKCCGGLLSPDAQRTFAQLGLSLPLDILENPQIFSVHTLDITENLERHYQRMYVNFNRHRFDLYLASLIPSSVDVLDSTLCTALEKQGGGFRLTYRRKGVTQNATAKYLVGAEGARSMVRDTFCPTPIRKYLSIQESYAVTEELPPSYVCFFQKELTDCYGWINRKDSKIQLGVALHPTTAKQDFEWLREYFTQLGYPFQQPLSREACLVCRPQSIREIQTGKEGIFLIGEAAGFVSTSSLEGISYALQSAMMLADAFNSSATPQRSYQRKTRKLKFRVLQKILKAKVIYTPFLRSLVMKSGITSLSLYKGYSSEDTNPQQ